MKKFFSFVLVLGILFAGIHRANETKANYAYRETVEHVVQAGETLWGIANDINPKGKRSVPRIIDIIKAETPGEITERIIPGQVIILPVFEKEVN